MNLRLGLYELAARHQLDAARQQQLHQLAGLGQPPAALARALPMGVAVLAAALAGLGLIFWVAANWDGLGRMGRFALLQGLLLAAGLAAVVGARHAAARAALGLVALLAMGGLLAYFGQTYQTGADAWQLFALWAALAVPLCLGARSDVLWAPWVLVAMAAVSLWLQTHGGRGWGLVAQPLPAQLAAWGAAGAITALLSVRWQQHTGAGLWGWRLALWLALGLVASTAVGSLFDSSVGPAYGLGLLVLGALAWLLARPGADVFALSAVALALNTLLVCGLGRLVLWNDASIPSFLLLGLVAAGLLAGTVKGVMHLARKQAP